MIFFKNSAPFGVLKNRQYVINKIDNERFSDKILAMNGFNFLQKSPNEINQLIATRIRLIRKGKHISQQRLSEKSGVSYGSIKRFEQSGEISLISLTKIAIVLEVSLELENLFEEMPILSIEEIINGGR